MSLYKKLSFDKNAASDGVFVDIGISNDDGTKPMFKIARPNAKANKKYQECFRKFSKEHGQDLETMSEDLADEKMLDIFLNSVLLDWQNVYDENEKLLPFSLENAKKILTDLPDLYQTLQTKAGKISTFQIKKREEEAKN